jgi:replicative DNA helicase
VSGAEPRPQATRGRLRPVSELDRQPPHNLEAEQAVLGAILAAGRLLVEVAAQLEEADFYRPAHRTIWRAILALADHGEPTDPVTILGELDHTDELAEVGGGPFLHTLVQAVPTVANAGHYARLVAEAARRRRVIDLGIRLAHSDADPAVLAHLAGELADTTTAGVGESGWTPPFPLGATGTLPPFPVEVLPGWLGEYVAAVATATQTPPDLAGMLALAVLATVAAGAVEVEPRPGWQEPLCLFVAVGMDAGARKSSVFTAMTRPLAEFERQQAAAALPAITETATLRRVAEQAAAAAEAAAAKAPADQAEAKQAEAVARAAEAANLIVPPLPRWLADDATPEALAGLLATHGRIALLSPEGDVFDQMAGRYNQHAGPNLGVYLKGHAGDLLKVDRRGRPPEYVQRPCLTIGLTVQPEVLRGLADRPGFRGRGLLARFLYSLPPSLVGRRQPGASPVPATVADRYAVELQALAASLTSPPGQGPTVLTLDPAAGELLLGFELELEPRLAAGGGDLAQLAGWAAKLAGATCRLAGLLHLARHLRHGWTQPIGADTFAGALRLAGYLVEHARAVFDLMGADPRLDDARWLLDWISRTNRAQFSRRDAHAAAPRGRFRKATDLDPALRLLEEHGYLRRVDADRPGPKGGRPASPRFLVNPLPRATEPAEPTKPHPPTGSVGSVGFVARGDTSGAANEPEVARHVIQRRRPQPLPGLSGVELGHGSRSAARSCAATTYLTDHRPLQIPFGELRPRWAR